MQYVASNNAGVVMPAGAAVVAAPTMAFSSASEAYAALSKAGVVQQSSYVSPTIAPVTVSSQQAVTYAAPAAATTYSSPQAVTYAAPSGAVAAQPAVSSYVGQAQVQVAQGAPAAVIATVGDWQICQDELGQFYLHTPTGQQFDQAPADLLPVLGMQQPAPYVATAQQAAVSYVQPQAATVLAQSPSYLGQPVVTQAAPAPAQNATVVKATVGDWMICQDNLGEFYSHTPTGQQFEQAPPELLQLLGGAPAPVQYGAAMPAAQYAAQPQAVAVAPAAQSVVKSVVGDWQICGDGLGEFYCYTPTGQTFDQPPAELLQLLGTLG